MAFLVTAVEINAADLDALQSDGSAAKHATVSTVKKPYEFTISPTVKKVLIGTGIIVGTGLAWYYGVPLLYNIGYSTAKFVAPTQGWQYYAWGSQAYCHAGMTCANSTAAHVTLNAAGSAVGGTAAGGVTSAFESVATGVGRLFWESSNNNS